MDDLEVDLIFQIEEIELARARVQHGNLFACIETDARLRESGADSESAL
jgi:hypothetical protein